MSRPPSMQYHSNQQQQNRPLETPLSQYTSTPTPNAPIKQYTQKQQQHPGRSIIGANGIQDHNLYKEATRRMTNAQVRKGHMFSTSGIEPDIQLNYSPRTVNNLINLHYHLAVAVAIVEKNCNTILHIFRQKQGLQEYQ